MLDNFVVIKHTELRQMQMELIMTKLEGTKRELLSLS